MNLYRWVPHSFVDSPNGTSAVVFVKGCCLSCMYCHNPQLRSFDRENDDLLYEDIIQRIDRLHHVDDGDKEWNEVDWITISGGEPLCSDIKELMDIMSYAKKKGFKVCIYTTGLYPDKIEKLAFTSLWTVDFFHIDYKYYDVMMHKEYDVDRKTLNSIHKIARECKNAKFTMCINTTVMKSVHTDDVLFFMKNELERVLGGIFPIFLHGEQINPEYENRGALHAWILNPINPDRNINTLKKLNHLDYYNTQEIEELKNVFKSTQHYS